MLFSLTELRVLSGLAQQKTLASIGVDLFLGQPSISRILRSAERKAGVQLVQRRGHRLQLTPAGIELAQAAQAITGQLEELETLLHTIRSGQGGPLRLITTYTPGNYVLAVAIGDFLQCMPNVRVTLDVRPVEQISEAFRHEAYDLGVGPPVSQAKGLLLERLYDDPVVLFVGPSSPLANVPQLRWADLRNELFIGSFSDPYWAPLFDEFQRRGLIMERRMDLRALEGVKRLVRAGVGIGVSLESALHDELTGGQVRALTLGEPMLSAPLYLVRRVNTRLTPVAREFRAFLLRRFQGQHCNTAC